MKRSSKLSRLGAASVLAATVAFPLAASAASKCHLAKVAELPITMSGMRGIVTLKVNGVDAPIVLDTGAWYSMITPEAAARLKVRTESGSTIRMVGIGGQALAGVGTAREVQFGGIPIKNVQFVIGGTRFDEGSIGLLGQNFLQMFDVEYDMANGVVRLFRPHDCAGVRLGYWAPDTQNEMTIDPLDEDNPHIVGQVQLNGHKIKVLFDTGATTTILDRDAADRAGVSRTDGTEAGGVGGGIGKGLVETWVAPVTNLDLGDEVIKKTRMRVGRLGFQDSDMLMGMDFFLSHHLLVSNSQHRIYFTYNGGPVFDIGRAAPKRVASTTAGAGAEDAKLSAVELGRRAKASLSRRDSAAAIADLSRAMALEPDNPDYLADRARAHLMTGDSKEARTDLDHALKLKSDHVSALEMRGYLLVKAGEVQAAEQDFDAAAKAAPNDADLRIRVASAYAAADRYDLEVREYGRWLTEHPKDPGAWQALNGRCWARAMWNHELQEGLADCDQAVRKGASNSDVLDSRGMINLRLGRYREAVADYDAALKKQSRAPWSILGRGLAKEKLGDKAGAANDIHQAVALDPDIVARARKIGLESAFLPTVKSVNKDEKNG